MFVFLIGTSLPALLDLNTCLPYARYMYGVLSAGYFARSPADGSVVWDPDAGAAATAAEANASLSTALGGGQRVTQPDASAAVAFCSLVAAEASRCEGPRPRGPGCRTSVARERDTLVELLASATWRGRGAVPEQATLSLGP